ncbi:hypothetical protein EDC15_10513 [Acetobacter aceti NBRC 14818]|jgi:hypothetical protein|nr:hypothetical protein EDC15_10513 [Acetobacter aceti NBRC 14818]
MPTLLRRLHRVTGKPVDPLYWQFHDCLGRRRTLWRRLDYQHSQACDPLGIIGPGPMSRHNGAFGLSRDKWGSAWSGTRETPPYADHRPQRDLRSRTVCAVSGRPRGGITIRLAILQYTGARTSGRLYQSYSSGPEFQGWSAPCSTAISAEYRCEPRTPTITIDTN